MNKSSRDYEAPLIAFGSTDTHISLEDGTEITCCNIYIQARERKVSFTFPLGLDINPLDIHNKDVYVRFRTENNVVRYPILLKNLKYDTFHMNVSIDDVVIEKILYYNAELILDTDNLSPEERQKYEK